MRKFLKSFIYAWQGIRWAIKNELNLKVHLSIALLVVFLGYWLRIATCEWLVCLLCMGVVLSAEVFNTALETLVDKVSPQKDVLAGRVKDLAAGAVLILATVSLVIGLVIFLPKIIAIFLK